MTNLMKSTLQADAAVDACTCTRNCGPGCRHSGEWHTHADDACAVHPQRLVE